MATQLCDVSRSVLDIIHGEGFKTDTAVKAELLNRNLWLQFCNFWSSITSDFDDPQIDLEQQAVLVKPRARALSKFGMVHWEKTNPFTFTTWRRILTETSETLET